MNIEDIRRIIELMQQNELSEFELEEESFRLTLKRQAGAEGGPSGASLRDPGAGASPSLTEAGDAAQAEWVPVKSPMVGTFYRSSAPDSEPYVNLGDEVEEDTVVCIIEAMKVMNEIKAEVRGIVKKILVENASPIQFGQPLFLLEPA
jgi:acetyl-CoA carboxylase biotin carboxyl carrier protein